ncbi:hypothetical protein GCM10025867_37810 [Frondihabitans sucicola]|uniref:Uncharacterized protein n=1 Tax=Frondihabitans sucicola TaxID=1268041 RepID=A0ABN6Y6I6_9MICO|nr:hypothetical protein GCM10025867_37810 [Frondihabitans sucicola]
MSDGEEREEDEDDDSDGRGVEDAPDEALEVDPARGVGQQQPGQGIEEERRAAEEGDHHGDPAHDDRVDAESRGETAADAADPGVAAAHTESADPVEEALAGCCGGPRRGGGRSVL